MGNRGGVGDYVFVRRACTGGGESGSDGGERRASMHGNARENPVLLSRGAPRGHVAVSANFGEQIEGCGGPGGAYRSYGPQTKRSVYKACVRGSCG